MAIHLDRHQHYGLLIIPRPKNNLLAIALPISAKIKMETKSTLNRRSTSRNYIFYFSGSCYQISKSIFENTILIALISHYISIRILNFNLKWQLFFPPKSKYNKISFFFPINKRKMYILP